MLVTKNAAELCVLLIREVYGQLPARVFEVLLSKGRSTVRQLAHVSSLAPRLVRHGLAVLIQQNLIYHHTDPDTKVTNYDANPRFAYDLVRNGKILESVHRNYGEQARKIVHTVMLSGHIRVSGLVKEFHSRQNEESSQSDRGLSDYEIVDCAAYLVAVGILEPLTPRMLQAPQDIKAEVEKDEMKKYPTGLRGKQKGDYDTAVAAAMRAFLDESKQKKRELEHEYLYSSNAKRRKLADGGSANGLTSGEYRDMPLDINTTLRINYEKCLVELRNQRLCHYVDDVVGHTTAQVYGAMLAVLSKKLPSCQSQPGDEQLDPSNQPTVTTTEIFEHLKPSVDVFSGLGKCEPNDINVNSAEKIQKDPPSNENDMDDQAGDNDATLDDGADDEGDSVVMTGATNGFHHVNGNHEAETETKIVSGQNGTRDTKVKFADRVPSKAERMQQMRQHLLLLAETSQQFVRHCGTKDHGEWTVDLEHLMAKLRLRELDTLIEDRFGREGLRLVKILRAKGKLDDKTLPTLALMKKGDVQIKMAEMELAGYLDVQEVPRDNNRTAARTLFLWFFDQNSTMAKVLDNTYKAMVNHLQRLDVERQKKKNVLSVVERKDVQGMEEEKLRGDIYNEYQDFLDVQSKLLGQLARLDDLVSVLRDY